MIIIINAAIAQSLENCPVDVAFKMIVDVGNDYWIQKIPVIASRSAKVYQRIYRNSAWGSWQTFLTNADLPLKANVWQLESNGGSDSFSYSHSCLIFASRGNSYGVYMCDNWNAVATIHNLEDVSVSVSNHTVTVANNRSSGAIGVIVIGNTNLSY